MYLYVAEPSQSLKKLSIVSALQLGSVVQSCLQNVYNIILTLTSISILSETKDTIYTNSVLAYWFFVCSVS